MGRDRPKNVSLAGGARSQCRADGVGTRKRPLGEDRLPDAVRWLSSPEDLREIEIDLLVEAAGREAVAPWGQAALERGIDFAVCSTSAFCDEPLLQQLIASAESGGCKLLIPPGALAGVDALAAAAILPLESVNHRIIKPPQAWKGTIAEDLVALDELSAPATFFEGTAREAARRFPANANVAAITALAGIGLDRTQVSLVADPGAQGNRHHLAIRGDFGCLEVLDRKSPARDQSEIVRADGFGARAHDRESEQSPRLVGRASQADRGSRRRARGATFRARTRRPLALSSWRRPRRLRGRSSLAELGSPTTKEQTVPVPLAEAEAKHLLTANVTQRELARFVFLG